MCQWILFGRGLSPLAVVIVVAILRGKKLAGKLPDDDYVDKFIATVWKKYFNSVPQHQIRMGRQHIGDQPAVWYRWCWCRGSARIWGPATTAIDIAKFCFLERR
jgi:hypothetical protein